MTDYKKFLPKVSVLHITPPIMALLAIRQCYESFANSDTEFYLKGDVNKKFNLEKALDYIENYGVIPTFTDYGDKDKNLIRRIISSGHESTLEHILINFRFNGYSRLMLQELARHRIASYSIKSTRYTLKELKYEVFVEYGRDGSKRVNYENILKYINPPLHYFESNSMVEEFCDSFIPQLEHIKGLIGLVENDTLKYYLPDCYRTAGVFSFNIRSLRNFLKLRMSRQAHPEIRHLATNIFNEIMGEERFKLHRIFFEDLVKSS